MPAKFGLPVIDRELACAPFGSPEGQDYYAAMYCAANMSFANRQVILHRVREVFARRLRAGPAALGIRTVYDVAHNTAKLERHRVAGEERTLLVHRKGATRAFPPGHPELPEAYRDDRPARRSSAAAWRPARTCWPASRRAPRRFFSTAHGSGRTMSRHAARKRTSGRELLRQMEARGMLVRAASLAGLAEEAGYAYKDVDAVAEASERAGLSRRVAHLLPVANVKG